MFHRFISRTLVAGLIGSLMLFTLACSSSDDTVPDEEVVEDTLEPEDQSVVLYQYRFNPNSLEVVAGAQVTFENRDPEAHNINIPALDIDESIDPNEEWTYTFDTQGEFAVGNRFSEGMQLDLTVE